MLKFLILVFFFTFSLPALSSNQHDLKLSEMRKYANENPGHKKLETHSFIQMLKDNTFNLRQIGQFFCDKEYIFEKIESILISQGLIEMESCFVRSPVYKEKLKQLHHLFPKSLELTSIIPSDAAKAYGQYLESFKNNEERAIIHAWLYSLGETFGAQHISTYILNRYPDLGNEIKVYQGIKLLEVRKHINEWISSINELTSNDALYEIDQAYAYLYELFEGLIKKNKTLGTSSACPII